MDLLSKKDLELKAKLPPNFGVTPFYKLRWRFMYRGRRDRIGCWNGTQHMANKHNYQPKDGLLWAICEAEKIGAWTVREFFRCEGQDFFTIRWIAATSCPMFLGKNAAKMKDQYTLNGTIIGMSMYTRKHVCTAMVDGKIYKRPIKQSELSIKLAEHSLPA